MFVTRNCILWAKMYRTYITLQQLAVRSTLMLSCSALLSTAAENCSERSSSSKRRIFRGKSWKITSSMFNTGKMSSLNVDMTGRLAIIPWFRWDRVVMVTPVYDVTANFFYCASSVRIAQQCRTRRSRLRVRSSVTHTLQLYDQKRRNLSSRNQHLLVTQGVFFTPKNLRWNFNWFWVTTKLAPNTRKIGKMGDFRPISRYLSELIESEDSYFMKR